MKSTMMALAAGASAMALCVPASAEPQSVGSEPVWVAMSDQSHPRWVRPMAAPEVGPLVEIKTEYASAQSAAGDGSGPPMVYRSQLQQFHARCAERQVSLFVSTIYGRPGLEDRVGYVWGKREGRPDLPDLPVAALGAEAVAAFDAVCREAAGAGVP